MNKEQTINTIKVVVFALVLSVGMQYVSAQTWTAPTVAPPAGNTYAPLNVGSSGQTKDGGLILGFGMSGQPTQFSLLAPYGKVGIGSAVHTSANPDYQNAAVKFNIFGSGVQRLQVESTDTNAARIDLKNNNRANEWHVQAFNNSFQIVDSGVVPALTIVSGPRIGIGTDTPGANAALDVNGRIKIQGGTPGAGKVLSSDNGGLGTWKTLGVTYSNCESIEVGAGGNRASGISGVTGNSWMCGDGKVVKDISSNSGDLGNSDYVLCCTMNVTAQ